MKTVAAIIASLLLSVVTFSIGAFGAILYLSTPEEGSLPKTTVAADLWTTEPTVVARNQRQLERPATRQISTFHDVSGDSSGETMELKVSSDDELDMFVTGSVAGQENQRATAVSREHVQWCMSRYNSYRADDGTYQPYDGKRTLCISPYIAIEREMHAQEAGAAKEVLLSAHRALGKSGLSVTAATADLNDHIHKCSKRYRSYRPEDNTYQPFDGGRRRQCR